MSAQDAFAKYTAQMTLNLQFNLSQYDGDNCNDSVSSLEAQMRTGDVSLLDEICSQTLVTETAYCTPQTWNGGKYVKWR